MIRRYTPLLNGVQSLTRGFLKTTVYAREACLVGAVTKHADANAVALAITPFPLVPPTLRSPPLSVNSPWMNDVP